MLADTKNALLTYVGMALIFGLISGVVGGITIGSLRSALFGGVAGAIIGGSVTGLVIKAAMFLYIREKQLVSSDPELNLFVPFMLHASFGMAVGLASAFALRSVSKLGASDSGRSWRTGSSAACSVRLSLSWWAVISSPCRGPIAPSPNTGSATGWHLRRRPAGNVPRSGCGSCESKGLNEVGQTWFQRG